ncbi:MAG: exodeoxyribonuclease VII small subunit [Candidatus Omnitrophica bacterium CG11_big_fil_rev_8_21_14_0_20_64_10]|nr:MAG: exodeoxyribonuclease VII small subunit [Candidatus Omnitrophica bacterium CG11_big_fil_rev_8_21_14_0_20_64_10]
MAKAKESKKSGFEGSLERLEAIVEEMQGNDLPLEERLKRFEEGVALVRECKKSLEGAAKKVEVLVKSSGGKLESRLFDEVRERLRETGEGEYEADQEEA